jgi:catechol 2,3-dioxygenase-like lactoylglutathione lyase family enzyme
LILSTFQQPSIAAIMADFDQQTSKVLAPSALAHVVLQTANLDRMIDFYTTFLGGTVTHKNEMLAFITYDEEHHRIALIGLPNTSPKVRGSCGLDHISFTFPDLTSLLLAYRQRKARGIDPVWSVNHGPTTSMYYKDPDGNKLETQVDNFDTNDAAAKFMESAAFAENPIGTDFDPEELIERIQAGEDDGVLKKRVEIGIRGIPEDF